MEIIALILSILVCWLLVGMAGAILLQEALYEPGDDKAMYAIGVWLGPLWFMIGLSDYLRFR